MNFHITEFLKGEQPPVTMPSPLFLELMTEQGIRKMVSDHYDLLRNSPVGHLFPQNDIDFEHAKLRSSDFFIQILGGTPYYKANRGQPMLTRRHEPFAITMEYRAIWLDCYRQVLQKLDIPQEVLITFWEYLNVFSIWMVNTSSDSISNHS